MAEQFLSDTWLDEVARIRTEFGDDAPSAMGDARLNLVVTSGPDGNKELHVSGGDFGKGLLDDAPATLTIDHVVAKALFVDANREAAIEAFGTGKLKIDGDISALMGMAGGSGNSDVQKAYQKRIQAITEGAPQRSTIFGPMSQELLDLGLETYAEELAEKGLTVVPAEVHGVTAEQFDHVADCILTRAEELTSCQFTLVDGPLGELVYEEGDDSRFALLSKVNQFLVHRCATLDRAFRDLAVNPAQIALIRHMMGQRGARFSSFNCFVKWPGEYGYGPGLGLHNDQMGVPGRTTHALNANGTWNLTEYTKEDGCLAYVPGSHLEKQPSTSAEAAVPVEAPRGSLIVFHGATVHGAYPKQTPGLRLTLVNYFRHQAILPQEEIKNGFPRELAEDCVDSDLFCELAGYADIFPFVTQTSTSPTPHPHLAAGG
jgi:hypothetical protein